MATLHLISQSLNHDQFLQKASWAIHDTDQLLFIADGVLNLLNDDFQQMIRATGWQHLLLAPDCQARGIEPMLSETSQLISDEQMVDACATADRVMSW